MVMITIKTTSALLILISANLYAQNQQAQIKVNSSHSPLSIPCAPSTAITDLDIGNVRASIFINGDMWWDLVGTSHYEVPKGSGKTSIFSGALWIGGTDQSGHTGNIKVAAQTYRQSGSDFWPGPIDTVNCSTTSTVCSAYDRHWKITRSEVQNFISGAPPTNAILTWPGNGDLATAQPHYLAPFIDVNNDGEYHSTDGDYPAYNFIPGTGICNQFLQGDQTLWWVFNDVGNVHTESGSTYSIGVEIHAQAFAFQSADSDLANATFYSYKIINRCSASLYNSFIGEYVDVDLGNAFDDYVGCDVRRNLGYGYNGDPDDDGLHGYGLNPPAVGIVILQGPLADPNDAIDNDRDSIIDEVGEEMRMSKFVYYDNSFAFNGNPSSTTDYYNYMRGIWKDNSPLVYGGNGYQTAGYDSCDFMFPGNTDPYGWGTHGAGNLFPWSEFLPLPAGAPNTPDDRRFLMSSGQFTLMPGAVIDYCFSAVWARASSGGPLASVAALQTATDRIQYFFDGCFTAMPAGISELTQINVSVYPNPSNDRLNINYNTALVKPVALELFDMNGRSVRIISNLPQEKYLLNTRDLLPGVYYFKLRFEKGKEGIGKFLVVR